MLGTLLGDVAGAGEETGGCSPETPTSSDNVVPLIGARRRDRLASTRSLGPDLSAGNLTRIEQAVPAGAAAGNRYRFGRQRTAAPVGRGRMAACRR